jgi:hypothetical protein
LFMQGSTTQFPLKRIRSLRLGGWLVLLVFLAAVLFPVVAACETLGVKDLKGNFVPRVTVTVGNKEVEIKKIDPQARFASISIALNSKYHKLLRNVTHLEIQWVNANNEPGKPLLFAGPLYNSTTKVYQAPMTKSLSLKLLDKTKLNLFAGKTVSDLFTMSIGDQQLISAESVPEKERTVQLGTGRDVSINVDKTSIVFNEDNLKKGEMLNVDNRSGSDQVIGVELPEKGLLYDQIIKKPEQTKIPRENWDRFTLASDSGIFIVLIPEADPAQLAQLNGKDIVIKIFQGNKITTRKIPIRTSSDLRASETESPPATTASRQSETPGQPSRPEVRPSQTAQPAEPSTSAARKAPVETSQANRPWGGLWLWVLQIFSLVLLVGLAVYAIFFMLPKIQVLEDRLAKNEMFIHSSREAIREELDRIKAEILRQCQKDPTEE